LEAGSDTDFLDEAETSIVVKAKGANEAESKQNVLPSIPFPKTRHVAVVNRCASVERTDDVVLRAGDSRNRQREVSPRRAKESQPCS
jgi:hypothetical protein